MRSEKRGREEGSWEEDRSRSLGMTECSCFGNSRKRRQIDFLTSHLTANSSRRFSLELDPSPVQLGSVGFRSATLRTVCVSGVIDAICLMLLLE
jgi:hypothetical protein